MKLQVGERVVIEGVVDSVEDVGNNRQVVTIRIAHNNKKLGVWADFCQRGGPEPQPPAPSTPGPGSNPAALTTLHISAGTPVNV
jgi:hypothetical protein